MVPVLLECTLCLKDTETIVISHLKHMKAGQWGTVWEESSGFCHLVVFFNLFISIKLLKLFTVWVYKGSSTSWCSTSSYATLFVCWSQLAGLKILVWRSRTHVFLLRSVPLSDIFCVHLHFSILELHISKHEHSDIMTWFPNLSIIFEQICVIKICCRISIP